MTNIIKDRQEQADKMTKRADVLASALIGIAVIMLVAGAHLAFAYLSLPEPIGMGRPGLTWFILTVVCIVIGFVKLWRSLS